MFKRILKKKRELLLRYKGGALQVFCVSCVCFSGLLIRRGPCIFRLNPNSLYNFFIASAKKLKNRIDFLDQTSWGSKGTPVTEEQQEWLINWFSSFVCVGTYLIVGCYSLLVIFAYRKCTTAKSRILVTLVVYFVYVVLNVYF